MTVVPRGARGRAAAGALLLAACLVGWDLLDGPGPGSPPPPEEPAAREARVAAGIEGVRERFRAVERRTLEEAEALVPTLLEAVPHPTDAREDRAALFAALEEALGEEPGEDVSGAAVVDREGRPLAWWGRIFLGGRAGPPGDRPSTRVMRSNVYKVLAVEIPLTGPGGDASGAVRVYAPFHADLPLHNRYVRRRDFEAEAERALRLEKVRLRFAAESGEEGSPPDPATGRGALEGILGDAHGIVEVTVRAPEQADALARASRSRGRRGAAAGILALLVLFGAPARFLRRGAPRALAGAAAVLLLRGALLLLRVPGDLAGGELFDPSAFSVAWGAGLLRTPADVLLTGAALLAAAVLAVRALPRPGEPAPAVARGAAPPPAARAAAAGGAAWLALARAAAFQSRVEPFPEDRILAGPAASALLLGTGCVAAAALVLLHRLLGVVLGRALPPRGAAARFLLLATAAAVLVDGSVQYQALLALRQDALAAAERLEPSAEREERVLLENLLERLARPGSAAGKALRGRGLRREDAAFFLWAEEPDLNGRADGCAVDILEADGSVLSRFDIDVPPRSWLPDPPAPGDAAGMTRLPGRKGAAGRSWFAGSAPVLAEDDGRLLGTVRLFLPSAASALPQGPRPEILRNYGGSRAPPGGRAIHRAIFDGAVLRESTHPDWPRGMKAPREAVEAVLERGEPLVWVREEVAGNHYHDAYLPRVEDGRVTGLLSVGFPSLTARTLLLNLARTGFLHLLAALVLGAAAGAAALARGRARLPAFGFRAKVLTGFVLVGALPVVGLALLERSLAGERTAEAMEREVVESLRHVEGSLRDAGVLDAMVALAASPVPLRGGEAQALVGDDAVKEIAYRAGVPVNLYFGDVLLASSERGIFATELFSARLPGPACAQVVLLGRGAFTARERFGSFPFLVGYAPVKGADGAVAGVISVPLLYRQDRADRDLARTTTAALALYVLVLMAVAGAGAVIARRMARPVEALAEGTRRVASGDLDFRIPRGPRDELGNLVDSFNEMTGGLAAGREAAARAEREAAWREMAKQVAHEIKNPLTPMRLHAQHLLRAQRDGSADLPRITEKAAEVILRQTEALQRIASDFSAFARLPRRSPEPLDLAAMAREAADLYRGSEDVEVAVLAEEGLPPVTADREEMRLVLVNLCGNAVESMPGGGRLSIALRAGEGGVVLEVADTGVGIPPGDMGRLFDPSFSTKTRGTGLGLAIVQRAVQDTGGTIEVRSEVGKGSVFTVRLPA